MSLENKKNSRASFEVLLFFCIKDLSSPFSGGGGVGRRYGSGVSGSYGGGVGGRGLRSRVGSSHGEAAGGLVAVVVGSDGCFSGLEGFDQTFGGNRSHRGAGGNPHDAVVGHGGAIGGAFVGGGVATTFPIPDIVIVFLGDEEELVAFAFDQGELVG